MKEFKYVVTDNEGIHARPAGELVKLVKGFESTISIEKEGKKVDCRKLLALMGLGVQMENHAAEARHCRKSSGETGSSRDILYQTAGRSEISMNIIW